MASPAIEPPPFDPGMVVPLQSLPNDLLQLHPRTAASGGTFIIGATFTFIWVDVATGDPTDMDRNGKEDVAFREIYYNNHFVWSVDTPAWTDSEIDVESIALHESGHGLSQAHFGMVFFDGMGQRTTRCSICISHPAQ